MTKEERRTYDTAYRAANSSKVKAKHVRYYAAHSEKERARSAARYASNPKKSKAYTTLWRDANPEKVRRNRLKTYGLSIGAYQLMLLQQRNACAICKEIFSKEPRVDHDHKTGEVRGLLCSCCNIGLGVFKDSLENLESAKEYLLGR